MGLLDLVNSGPDIVEIGGSSGGGSIPSLPGGRFIPGSVGQVLGPVGLAVTGVNALSAIGFPGFRSFVGRVNKGPGGRGNAHMAVPSLSLGGYNDPTMKSFLLESKALRSRETPEDIKRTLDLRTSSLQNALDVTIRQLPDLGPTGQAEAARLQAAIQSASDEGLGMGFQQRVVDEIITSRKLMDTFGPEIKKIQDTQAQSLNFDFNKEQLVTHTQKVGKETAGLTG